MGYYINRTSNGMMTSPRYEDKIIAIINDGAVHIDEPTEWCEGLVCILNNGMFGAAGYAYSEAEMNVFKRGYGGRQRQWFIYDKAKQFAQ